ncbi:hypothetical protein P3T76_013561 [Phytophthora citrophthora]|uniref:Uncharacterized protein n=1 Tax=Phytophthora citrophthora TaxID=4793 RepID=A0AAD9G3W5_9STRA|nr:hypothetical protein P3T76_013561 [Phytophthora citrophthora]
MLLIDFLLLDATSDVVHVQYSPPAWEYNTPSRNSAGKGSISIHTVCMVLECQPSTEWPLEMELDRVPAPTTSIHRLFALQQRKRIDNNSADVLVNRRVRKRKRAVVGLAPTNAGAGRPPLAGRALEQHHIHGPPPDLSKVKNDVKA